ncbi:MAG: flavodoxin family protein [Clostridia bacterium]|nr:flavodoxin family protein [Clostridia bacterium]
MKILGISGSARKGRIIEQTVTAIAGQLEGSVEIISLTGKRINGCTGCTMCALDNICKQSDDWNSIGQKMTEADIIIFGAPNYYGMMNALSHACLERTFSFRHGGAFSLKGKRGIIVSTSRGKKENDPVKENVERFMRSNQMEVIGHVAATGYDQCYTCGIGHECVYGNVVRKHGIIDKIEKHHLPLDFSEQMTTHEQIEELIQEYKGGNI